MEQQTLEELFIMWETAPTTLYISAARAEGWAILAAGWAVLAEPSSYNPPITPSSQAAMPGMANIRQLLEFFILQAMVCIRHKFYV